jgi:uncharacterized protein YhhL (DUF1145 family)
MNAAKTAVALVWVLCIASYFVATESTLAGYGQLLFWVMLVAHAGECLFFLSRLRAAPGGLAHNLVQTMIFGVVHVRTIPDAAGPGQAV